MTVDLGERAARFKVLIQDRDRKFMTAFHDVFAGNGVRIIRTPVRSPPGGLDEDGSRLAGQGAEEFGGPALLRRGAEGVGDDLSGSQADEVFELAGDRCLVADDGQVGGTAGLLALKVGR
jgi:hypothetical protein